LANARAYCKDKTHVFLFKEGTCKLSFRLLPHRGDNTTQKATGLKREPIVIFDKIPLKANV
jgi:hypothetical protein